MPEGPLCTILMSGHAGADKDIKDLSTILTLSGPINCTILALYGSMTIYGTFWGHELHHFGALWLQKLGRTILALYGSRT